MKHTINFEKGQHHQWPAITSPQYGITFIKDIYTFNVYWHSSKYLTIEHKRNGILHRVKKYPAKFYQHEHMISTEYWTNGMLKKTITYDGKIIIH